MRKSPFFSSQRRKCNFYGLRQVTFPFRRASGRYCHAFPRSRARTLACNQYGPRVTLSLITGSDGEAPPIKHEQRALEDLRDWIREGEGCRGGGGGYKIGARHPRERVDGLSSSVARALLSLYRSFSTPSPPSPFLLSFSLYCEHFPAARPLERIPQGSDWSH